jgi:uncharacterized protein with NAD-binding domain and iron-sulfur cluster
VAGLSAAHELVARGFEVTVLEARDVVGGKARSTRIPGSAGPGRAPLPGEHGFRFFPGFYRHLPDTMARIPFEGRPGGVAANLVEAPRSMVARDGRVMTVVNHFPKSLSDLALTGGNAVRQAAALVTRDPNAPGPADSAYFARLLLTLATSSEARYLAQWEDTSWWDFTDASRRSPAYRDLLADGMTRTLVAARAREMSTRTGGLILLQMLADSNEPGREADRVLCGPTSDVWLTPWADHLRSVGVDLRLSCEVTGLELAGGSVAGVRTRGPAGEALVEADWYVAAVPVEHMVALSDPALLAAEPALARLPRLTTRWMNGIVFYLRRDDPVVPGHVICADSAWSLTAISQRQFWSQVDFERLDHGQVGGTLSVDISDWTSPGLATAKTAMQCGPDEIAAEVLVQLRRALGPGAGAVLAADNVVTWSIDNDVRFPALRPAGVRTDLNLEPLLVNTAGSWWDRPEAATALPNLFLASDYVRTTTNLATMEGANEAARRAVNALLARAGSPAQPCTLYPLRRAAVLAPLRHDDQRRLAAGKPNRFDPGRGPGGAQPGAGAGAGANR